MGWGSEETDSVLSGMPAAAPGLGSALGPVLAAPKPDGQRAVGRAAGRRPAVVTAGPGPEPAMTPSQQLEISKCQ